jgi:hypothetical protein
MVTRYWAVRVGQYVEIRKANNRPRLETSKVRKVLKYRRRGKQVSKVVTIVVSWHVGGKPLGVVKDTKFYAACGYGTIGLYGNEVRQIDAKLKRRILGN